MPEQEGKRGFQMTSPEESADRGSSDLPPMTFATLVLSLSASAMVHLGVAPPESGETPPRNLPLARQTIDILEVLREKTEGNLTEEESRLFASVLHDLHLKFVEASRA